MSVTGADGLAKAQAEIQRVIQKTSALAYAMAPRFKDLTLKTWQTKTDPYGNAWKPDKAVTFKHGTISELVRTGTMNRKVDVLPFAKDKIKILLGVAYARFNISTGRRPLPKAGVGKGQLPPSWVAEVDRAVCKVIAEAKDAG